MALIRDFELPGTGFNVENAYHIIKNVNTEKRLQDIPLPPDSSRADGSTAGDRGPEVYWKSGYIGKIAIEVFASKEARDEGNTPIGAIANSPTDVSIDRAVATPGKAHEVLFFIDADSEDSILTQAYNHLKTTEYYQDAQEV